MAGQAAGEVSRLSKRKIDLKENNMPYIKIVANVPIETDKQDAIKTALAQHGPLIGKTEDWMMVDFCGSSPLYFSGTAEPAALASFDVYGGAGAEAYSKMTAAVTQMLAQELAVPPERIFVKYMEYEHWGWNGNNF
jgi:hypothetical protein